MKDCSVCSTSARMCAARRLSILLPSTRVRFSMGWFLRVLKLSVSISSRDEKATKNPGRMVLLRSFVLTRGPVNNQKHVVSKKNIQKNKSPLEIFPSESHTKILVHGTPVSLRMVGDDLQLLPGRVERVLDALGDDPHGARLQLETTGKTVQAVAFTAGDQTTWDGGFLRALRRWQSHPQPKKWKNGGFNMVSRYWTYFLTFNCQRWWFNHVDPSKNQRYSEVTSSNRTFDSCMRSQDFAVLGSFKSGWLLWYEGGGLGRK